MQLFKRLLPILLVPAVIIPNTAFSASALQEPIPLGKFVVDSSKPSYYELFGDPDESYFKFSNWAPGDVYSFVIELNNTSDEDYYTFIDVVDTDIKQNPLNSVINMTIEQNGYILSQGNCTSDTTILKKTRVPSKSTASLDVTLTFPPDTGNLYQNKEFNLSWEVVSEQVPIIITEETTTTTTTTTPSTTEPTETTKKKYDDEDPPETTVIYTDVSLKFYEEGTVYTQKEHMDIPEETVTSVPTVTSSLPSEPTLPETEISFEPIQSDDVVTGADTQTRTNPLAYVPIIVAIVIVVLCLGYGVFIFYKNYKKNIRK